MYKHWHYYTDKDTSAWPVVCNKIQFQRQKTSVAQKPETVPCFIGSWYFVFSYRPWTGQSQHVHLILSSSPFLNIRLLSAAKHSQQSDDNDSMKHGNILFQHCKHCQPCLFSIARVWLEQQALPADDFKWVICACLESSISNWIFSSSYRVLMKIISDYHIQLYQGRSNSMFSWLKDILFSYKTKVPN